MLNPNDEQYIAGMITDILKDTRAGVLQAYLITSLVDEVVELGERCDHILLTNTETGRVYKLPEELNKLSIYEPDLFSIMTFYYDDQTNETDAELAIEEVKIKSLRFGTLYHIDCYRKVRKNVHMSLTSKGAEAYVATHTLSSPEIVPVELYHISEELHSLLCCLVGNKLVQGGTTNDSNIDSSTGNWSGELHFNIFS